MDENFFFENYFVTKNEIIKKKLSISDDEVEKKNEQMKIIYISKHTKEFYEH